MDDQDNANAQGTETADPSTSGNEANNQEAPNGIQKRINELTARFKQSEENAARMVADKDAQIAELIRAVTVSKQPQVADPADSLDPDERKKFESMLAPITKRFEQSLQRMEQQFGQQQVRAVAAQVGDPRIEARAQELMRLWQTKGHTGWVADDAVRYAAGEFALADREQNASSRDERGRFNNAGSAPLTGGSSLPNMAPAAKALPGNFDSLPSDQQIALLEKRLEGKTF